MQMMEFDFFSNPMILMFFMGGMGLLNVIFAIFIYNDAMNNNNPNVALWVIIVFFTSFLGALIYLALKNSNHKRISDSGVSILNRPSKENTYGNSNLISKDALCFSCGKKNEVNSKYCENCGELIQ